jgi:NDP-sugar pyrophosphorylase family protein
VTGVPNIIRTIHRLKAAGIEEIVINTHWQPEVLKKRLGNGRAFEVCIHYSDEPILLGTGGGIKKALPFLGKDGFVVVNGDALFAPNFARIIQFHKAQGALATMVLRSDPEAETYGTIGIDTEKRIRRMVWVGKDIPELTPYMFCGVHVLEPEIASRLPDEGCIVRKTYIPLLEEDRPIFGIAEESYFCDLGTPERFLEANINLVTGKERLLGYEPNSGGIHIGEGVHLGAKCILKPGTVLCDRARIADGVMIENAVVMEDVFVDCNLHAEIATLDGIVDCTGSVQNQFN